VYPFIGEHGNEIRGTVLAVEMRSSYLARPDRSGRK
jgi:hypothetical protein